MGDCTHPVGKHLMERPRILILGGTGEGFALAERLAQCSDLEAISSLAGRTAAPRRPLGEYRTGGFGGVAGLRQYLIQNRIFAVLDATHPFANHISANAQHAAREAGIAICHIWREPWAPGDGDNWRQVATIEEAARSLPANATRVLLTIGSSELAAFSGRDDLEFVARLVAPMAPPPGELWPKSLEFVYDRGPFSLANEIQLMRAHEISHMVTKNSGGEAARAKLDAARELSVGVTMVRRPPPPTGILVPSVERALDWLDSQLAARSRSFSASQ